MFTLRQKVILWAIYTRVFVLFVQAFVYFAIKQTDQITHEAHNNAKHNFTLEWVQVDASSHYNAEDVDPTFNLSDALFLFFGGLMPKHEREVQNNLHISNNGYTYEENLLYFPLYPLMVKGLSNSFNWIFKDMFYVDDGLSFAANPALILSSSILLNAIFFIFATDRLYYLSRKVLKDEYLAYKSALFFCINPASVLFLAPLTLTLLSAATFAAMASVESGMGLFTGTYLAMATAAQPSGVLNLLMVLYSSMRQVSTQTILFVKHKKEKKKSKQALPDNDYEQMVQTFTTIGLAAVLPGIWCIVTSMAPFAAFQWFGFAAFCKLQKHEMGNFPEEVIEYGQIHNLTMPGQEDKPTWCYEEPPIPYIHVGGMPQFKEPFSHWVPEDWPHYIACTPAMLLILRQIGQFFKIHKKYCCRLGLVDNALLGMIKPKILPWNLTQALPREALIYLLQALLIILSTVCVTSLQGACRVIMATSPVLYWTVALSTTPPDVEPNTNHKVEHFAEFPVGDTAHKIAVETENGRNLYSLFSTLVLTEKNTSDISNWTKIYFFGYLSLGTMIFASDFPGL